MSQIFHPSTNTLSRVSIFGALFLIVGVLYLMAAFTRSDYTTEVNVAEEQPIQFSHKHHVADAGIDCRYCHTSVEKTASAGFPPTKTCMGCHSQLWSTASFLEPVRQSWKTEKPLVWRRVHDLPDYVYFNHSIHVTKGVGCTSCHGRVDQMPLMMKVNTLQMEWCLDCHRNPEKHLRPKSEIFNMAWEAPADQLEQGKQLRAEYGIRSNALLQSCSTCHR
jgi:hypothetical protein